MVLFRKDDIAKLFRVTTETITQWVNYYELPKPMKFGHIPYWREIDIQKFLKKRTLKDAN